MFIAPRMVYCSMITYFGALFVEARTTFRSVSYGTCSRTGVTCVASDFGRIIWSHHPLTLKRSVVRALTNRVQQYITTAEGKKSELAHVHNALRANGYPEWRLHIHHPVQKDHLTRTRTHEDLCWDYHTWQDYQNRLAGCISHITYTCTTSRRTPSARW